MALYLPIRAISRSQGVRVGGTKVSTTTTKYVDISDGQTRRELNHHSAIGAVVVVGPLTATDSDIVVETGGLVTANGSPDQAVDVSAGEVRVRSTGEWTAFTAASNLSATAAHGSLARVDIVQVDSTDGTVSYKAGTAAASPVAPDPDEDNVAIAEIARAANDNTIASGDITDVRPRP